MIRIAPSNRVIHSFRSSFTTVLKLGTREWIRWKVEESMNLPDSRESFRSLENEKATSSESPGTRVPFPRDDLSPTDTVLVAFTDNSVHAKYSSLHILLSLLPPPPSHEFSRITRIKIWHTRWYFLSSSIRWKKVYQTQRLEQRCKLPHRIEFANTATGPQGTTIRRLVANVARSQGKGIFIQSDLTICAEIRHLVVRNHSLVITDLYPFFDE